MGHLSSEPILVGKTHVGSACVCRKSCVPMGDKAKEPSALEEATAILSKCRGLSSRVATYANRLIGENDVLGVEINSLTQSIRKAESAAKTAKDKAALGLLTDAKDILRGLGPGGDLRKFLPNQRTPLMLRLFLGSKVNVVTLRPDQSFAIKEEYYRFRDRGALIMLLCPALMAIFMARAAALREQQGEGHSYAPGIMTAVQLYLTWLGYFYLAMSLRENVLMVNGSHIKGWWVQHHYWSSACALLMLGLPVYSPAVFNFCQRFMVWNSFQAIVMMVQNRYQRRRMYTRIALGKNSAMDVVGGESSGGKGQLLLLYPMLFALQFWQAALGIAVAYATFPSYFSPEGWLDVEHHASDLRGTRGTCLVGIVFTYMAVNNFIATLSTIFQKRQYASQAKEKAKKGKSS